MSKERQPRPEKLTLDKLVAAAQEVTLKQGSHLPTLFIEGSHQAVVITIQEMADTHAGRLEQMREAGWAMGSIGVVGVLEQVFFVSEAWFNMRDKDTNILVPISQDPHRKEGLVISVYNTVTNRADMRALEMVRDASGKLTGFQDYPPPSEEGTSVQAPLLTAFMEGYLFGLMNPPHAHD